MAERIELRVPDLGDFADVEIIEVLVAPGDVVAVEDGLVTLETDKATVEVPAPRAGVVRDFFAAAGDAVEIYAGALGLLVPAGDPLVVPVIAGAEEAADERGLLLWTAHHDGELTERYLRLLQSGAVDAALVAGLRAGYHGTIYPPCG